MKWQVEYITEDSNNILIVDENKHDHDWDAVAIGLPRALADRIVRLHNTDLEQLDQKLEEN